MDFPPLPKPAIEAIYATSENTESVRKGFEMGGYIKQPEGYTEEQMRSYVEQTMALYIRHYEELRELIDGGSESMTHEDAVEYLKERAWLTPKVLKNNQRYEALRGIGSDWDNLSVLDFRGHLIPEALDEACDELLAEVEDES